jgi:adenylosuccinate synthase
MDLKYADVVIGLQFGDEGKGKVSSFLSKDYDMVCRFNGGPNAGHTVYIENIKYKTHVIPCGIFYNKTSIVGPNCVLNLDKFYQEIEYLKNNGFDIDLIKVSPYTHVITDKHIQCDLEYLQEKFGTTGQGIAPAYSDKMMRSGLRAESSIDKKYIWDGNLKGKVLCEGAQSFWLDINYGNYPYVTSSETLPYAACSLGFSPKKINKIIGVAKIYETKSGVDPLFPDLLLQDLIFNKIIELGKEFGTTTGRKRIVNWMRIDRLIYAINKSGINYLIINKCDILERVNQFKLISDSLKNQIEDFKNLNDMCAFINTFIRNNLDEWVDIKYSFSPEYI